MAAEKMKPRTIVRGFRTYLSGIGDLPLALLLLTRLLLAALLLLATLTRLRLAALLLLTGLLLAALLATLLLLAGLLVWILIHRSFLSNIGSPLRSLVFHGKSQSAANAFVPRFTLRQCVWNLSPRVEFPFATRRTDDGTLYAFVADWGADSDSGARLAFWWPSLDA
ncbi:MAG: hypothetical protein WB769_00175 [Pseudolabrys sp.]|jgi:hypothetical protein